jgi:hypothetical protein
VATKNKKLTARLENETWANHKSKPIRRAINSD